LKTSKQDKYTLLTSTQTTSRMTKRGNRKASLVDRLANLQPRGIVPSVKIPGTNDWVHVRDIGEKYNAKKAQESFFANYSIAEIVDYRQLIPHTLPTGLKLKNEQLIDKINRWIDENDWNYIEGGEHDGSWVHASYPNRIFLGDSRTLPIRGEVSETVVFPVARNDEDPIGLACHLEVSGAGTRTNVIPNMWTHYDSTRKGRLQAKANARSIRRQKRWAEYQAAGKIKDQTKRNYAIQTLKAKFLSEDILKDNVAMGYDMDDVEMGYDMDDGPYYSDHALHDD